LFSTLAFKLLTAVEDSFDCEKEFVKAALNINTQIKVRRRVKVEFISWWFEVANGWSDRGVIFEDLLDVSFESRDNRGNRHPDF
jgi:hypothetical protein